jgi:DNA (cytosine-5)-methyltransferase 1
MTDFTRIIDIPEGVSNYIDLLYGKGFSEDNFSGKASYADLLAIVTHGLYDSKALKREYTCEEKCDAIHFVVDAMSKMLPQRDSNESKVCEDSADMFSDFFDVPFPAPANPKFTFIDLFAGMGGFRLGMQAQGGKCVFSSEWNKFAQRTYFANYGEMPFGDITKESTKSFVPEKFDVLCAGFPCQPFSIAGVSKKKSLGRETGFKDKTQGTLFFDVADIINRHRPKAFFLENVKNLTSHDKGRTFKVIKETLEELNYSIHYKVIDGKHYVPQHRERIMIVGFDKNLYHGKENFVFPEDGEPVNSIKDILLPNPDSKYTLTDKLWNYLQNYALRQKAKGNGFGYGLVDMNGITRTLSARYYKDGSEILIPQDKKNPRRLTPRECARLMGYPDSYILDAVSDVQGYRQCGNSVVVPLITAVSEQIIKTMIKK